MFVPSSKFGSGYEKRGEAEHTTPATERRGRSCGRRKIPIEYIREESRRKVIFSKRRFGLMKKAFELSVLSGSEVLVLVVSDKKQCYTYASEKFQRALATQQGQGFVMEVVNNEDESSDYHQRNNGSNQYHEQPKKQAFQIGDRDDHGSYDGFPQFQGHFNFDQNQFGGDQNRQGSINDYDSRPNSPYEFSDTANFVPASSFKKIQNVDIKELLSKNPIKQRDKEEKKGKKKNEDSFFLDQEFR